MKALTSRFFMDHLFYSQTFQYGCRDSEYNLEFRIKLWNLCAAQTINWVLGGNNVCLGNMEERRERVLARHSGDQSSADIGDVSLLLSTPTSRVSVSNISAFCKTHGAPGGR